MIRTALLLLAGTCFAAAALAQSTVPGRPQAAQAAKPVIQIGFEGRGRNVKQPPSSLGAGQTTLSGTPPSATAQPPMSEAERIFQAQIARTATPSAPSVAAPAAPMVAVPIAAPVGVPATMPTTTAPAPAPPNSSALRSDSALRGDAAIARAKREAAAPPPVPAGSIAVPGGTVTPFTMPANSGLPLLPGTQPVGNR